MKTLPDFDKFSTAPRVMMYLHDRCRIDPRIAHSERFTITATRNPETSMIYMDRSIRRLRATANHLSRVWRGIANKYEAAHQ